MYMYIIYCNGIDHFVIKLLLGKWKASKRDATLLAVYPVISKTTCYSAIITTTNFLESFILCSLIGRPTRRLDKNITMNVREL
jgi:hypothetical protein